MSATPAALWPDIAPAQAATAAIYRVFGGSSKHLERTTSSVTSEKDARFRVFYHAGQTATLSALTFEGWRSFIRQTAPASPLHDLLTELAALEQRDLDEDERPTPLAILTARALLECSVALGVTPARVLASPEGGVFIAYVHGDHLANIEVFNTGHTFAATHREGVKVWPISTDDPGEVTAALDRIREQLAN